MFCIARRRRQYRKSIDMVLLVKTAAEQAKLTHRLFFVKINRNQKAGCDQRMKLIRNPAGQGFEEICLLKCKQNRFVCNIMVEKNSVLTFNRKVITNQAIITSAMRGLPNIFVNLPSGFVTVCITPASLLP